jgi:polyhydroxyalkanoate synthesis regulator phasin
MTFESRRDARREQMLSELASDMADLVESGDLTAEEANEWVNRAADRWSV